MTDFLLLKKRALQLRIDSIRATTESESGHPTSCMSSADIISTVFFKYLKYDLKNPKNPNNDRFILSKGHAIPIIYSAYKQLGVITDQELLSLRKFDSVLEGHPTPRFIYNEAATGSLGQGLAIGVGMAINAKIDNLDYKTYVLMGDGELAEGSVWEACQLASKYNLDNLIAIVDCNRLGQSGESINNHDLKTYQNKFKAFGFKTFIIDGHNIKTIYKTIQKALNIKNKPVIIIAKTYKGYGLDNIENKLNFHGKPFKKEEHEKIFLELKKRFKKEWEYKVDLNSLIYIPELPNKIKQDTNIKNISLDLTKDINSNLFDKNKTIATRKAFGYALESLGKVNKNIVALDADVQNSTYTEFFAKKYPERFIECFIAEQAMVSISTGLNLRKKIPFAATFGAFLTRAYDQIRMAAIGQNALRISGSHCGVSIGQDGPSQMALEDISMFASIPNSIILYPSDGVSAYKLTELMANYNSGVSYLRTSRPEASIIYDKTEEFKIGGCKVLRQSDKDIVCVIAAGVTLHEALKAYNILKEKNINISIIDLYSIKPLDIETIKKVAQKSNNRIITVEDHYINGGFGQMISSALNNSGIKVDILAVKNISRSGTPEELLAYAQIDTESIVEACTTLQKVSIF